MAQKSRVVLYAELRKKIEQMDNYSFLEEKESQTSRTGLKRTTLTLSLEEIAKEQEKFDEKKIQEETKKRFRKSKKEKKHPVDVTRILIISMISVVVIVILVLLIVLLTGEK